MAWLTRGGVLGSLKEVAAAKWAGREAIEASREGGSISPGSGER